MNPLPVLSAVVSALARVVSVLARAALGLFIYNKGKQAEQLEVSKEVIEDVRKANEAANRLRADAANARRVRDRFTRPE